MGGVYKYKWQRSSRWAINYIIVWLLDSGHKFSYIFTFNVWRMSNITPWTRPQWGLPARRCLAGSSLREPFPGSVPGGNLLLISVERDVCDDVAQFLQYRLIYYRNTKKLHSQHLHHHPGETETKADKVPIQLTIAHLRERDLSTRRRKQTYVWLSTIVWIIWHLEDTNWRWEEKSTPWWCSSQIVEPWWS